MTELERRVTEIVSLIAGDTARWDSVAHLEVVASLEQEFAVAISPEEARTLRSIPAICAFLTRARGG
jgi:acyl carrier protein